MEYVVVERRFDRPIDTNEAERTRNLNNWCVEQYRIRHLRSYVCSDMRRMLCVIRAPDAESVRIAALEKKFAVDQVWPASFHAPDGQRRAEDFASPVHNAGVEHGMSLVVVERTFKEPVAFKDIQAIENRGAWCLKLHDVQFLYTYFSFDRRRMTCMYKAPDAESVRQAQRMAEMPVDRVWAATILESNG